MTEAQFIAFVKGHLRRASRWWKPISEVPKEARKGRGVYLCNGCGELVPNSIVVDGKRMKGVFVDHKNPVVDPLTGFTGWDSFVNNLFCERENLQLLCKSCHDTVKSKEERKLRTESSEFKKQFMPNYQSWSNMNDRCYNPNSTGWEYYGERGIGVQESWRRDLKGLEAFKNFVEDMGERPEGTTLDRIDVNLGYTKENCRWATPIQQGNNKTDNHWVSCGGEVHTVAEWSRLRGLLQNTILYRLRRGWTPEEALGFFQRRKPYLSRLSKDTWNEIQKMRDEGYTTTQLGEIFNIDSSQVSRKTVPVKDNEERLLAKKKKEVE